MARHKRGMADDTTPPTSPGAKPIALEDRPAEDDGRLQSPSAGRNRGPIAAVLLPRLVDGASVLEVGSGTGEHACAFAGARPDILWRPSDPDAASRASIEAWAHHLERDNVLKPLALDVTADLWPRWADGPFHAVVSINMIHIAPWAACEGLVEGAGARLSPEGMLFLYGPFMRGGEHTAPSNADFDADLKRRDPDWGVRDLDDVARLANAAGMDLEDALPMPANNLSVVFRKRG